MKADVEHMIPLSAKALELINRMPRTGELVFPSKAGKELQNPLVLYALHKAGSKATAHGTARSSFTDWAEETLKYPHKLSEAALAHGLVDDNNTVKSYKRTTFFDRRIDLMADWTEYLYSEVK
jgi:integrase